MADKKISQLTAATTPLAGTEVLPIVQSSSTVKVAVSDLTAGRAVTANSFIPTSNTVPTNGMYLAGTNIVGLATNTTQAAQINASQNIQIGGTTDLGKTAIYYTSTAPSLSSNSGVGLCLRGNTTVRTNFGTESSSPYASWIQSTDGSGSAFGLKLQPLGGDVTIGNGNLVIGTSGKGIDFSATANSSGTMTSELLSDYEEGTWTPTDQSGAGLTITVTSAKYTKIGRIVTVNAYIQYPVTADTASAFISLPYTASSTYAVGSSVTGLGASVWPLALPSTALTSFRNNVLTPYTNAGLSGQTIIFTLSYEV